MNARLDRRCICLVRICVVVLGWVARPLVALRSSGGLGLVLCGAGSLGLAACQQSVSIYSQACVSDHLHHHHGNV
eukprot:3285837-Karenia_brevis.AAC.1